MTLGEKLAKLRREHNYTQEEFAEILNVSRQAVSKWESDIAYPETDKLIRIGELRNAEKPRIYAQKGRAPGASLLCARVGQHPRGSAGKI